MDREDLLQRITSYCIDQGVSESTFGLKARNDGKLVSRLRMGGGLMVDTLALIERQLTLPGTNSAWDQKERGAA